MNRMVLTVFAFLLFSSEASCMVQSMTAADIELLWCESSGPNREQDARVKPLYQAIINRDYREVELLLGKGLAANDLLYRGAYSPLMVALELNDKRLVELLLQRGAAPNYVSDDVIYTTPLAVALSTAMHEAVKNEHESANYSNFWWLVDEGADINLKFRDIDIAIYSASLGQIELVNQLLEKGYRRNLDELLKTMEIIVVDERTQIYKNKAIATIKKIRESH